MKCTLVNELHKAGYYISKELTNFGDFGVPQKRVRFLLVGIREDIGRAKPDLINNFFRIINEQKQNFLQTLNISLETNLGDAISDLNKTYGIIDSPDSKNFKAGIYGPLNGSFQALMRRNTPTQDIDSHRFANHRQDIIDKFDFILNNSAKNKHINEEIREMFSIKKHRIVVLDRAHKSPTITSLPDDYIHYSEPRILTVREYARIQTFPDWYEFKGKYTTGGERRIREVPRYTQIGNAIPPLFAEQVGAILKNIF
ncbi:DNA cytosine methyltransferase [Spirosoma spitsbergense]|uniref:DNA cytosine methyltransferase n=1 Tax=Spirosoma spitsbergense TaxID=431554 RepID=UPI00036A24FE|nr:DNA cytosine methyltransferase [Spirosoma spitsbergense]